MSGDIFRNHEKRRKRQAMRVIHLIVINWIAGALLGLAVVAVILWFDIAGVGRLILNANPMWPPLLLLCGGFMVTFSSVVAGTAIMLIPKDEDPPDDSPGGRREPAAAYARVVAR